jgi:hypothetical protein
VGGGGGWGEGLMQAAADGAETWVGGCEGGTGDIRVGDLEVGVAQFGVPHLFWWSLLLGINGGGRWMVEGLLGEQELYADNTQNTLFACFSLS